MEPIFDFSALPQVRLFQGAALHGGAVSGTLAPDAASRLVSAYQPKPGTNVVYQVPALMKQTQSAAAKPAIKFNEPQSAGAKQRRHSVAKRAKVYTIALPSIEVRDPVIASTTTPGDQHGQRLDESRITDGVASNIHQSAARAPATAPAVAPFQASVASPMLFHRGVTAGDARRGDVDGDLDDERAAASAREPRAIAGPAQASEPVELGMDGSFMMSPVPMWMMAPEPAARRRRSPIVSDGRSLRYAVSPSPSAAARDSQSPLSSLMFSNHSSVAQKQPSAGAAAPIPAAFRSSDSRRSSVGDVSAPAVPSAAPEQAASAVWPPAPDPVEELRRNALTALPLALKAAADEAFRSDISKVAANASSLNDSRATQALQQSFSLPENRADISLPDQHCFTAAASDEEADQLLQQLMRQHGLIGSEAQNSLLPFISSLKPHSDGAGTSAAASASSSALKRHSIDFAAADVTTLRPAQAAPGTAAKAPLSRSSISSVGSVLRGRELQAARDAARLAKGTQAQQERRHRSASLASGGATASKEGGVSSVSRGRRSASMERPPSSASRRGGFEDDSLGPPKASALTQRINDSIHHVSVTQRITASVRAKQASKSPSAAANRAHQMRGRLPPRAPPLSARQREAALAAAQAGGAAATGTSAVAANVSASSSSGPGIATTGVRASSNGAGSGAGRVSLSSGTFGAPVSKPFTARPAPRVVQRERAVGAKSALAAALSSLRPGTGTERATTAAAAADPLAAIRQLESALAAQATSKRAAASAPASDVPSAVASTRAQLVEADRTLTGLQKKRAQVETLVSLLVSHLGDKAPAVAQLAGAVKPAGVAPSASSVLTADSSALPSSLAAAETRLTDPSAPLPLLDARVESALDRVLRQTQPPFLQPPSVPSAAPVAPSSAANQASSSSTSVGHFTTSYVIPPIPNDDGTDASGPAKVVVVNKPSADVIDAARRSPLAASYVASAPAVRSSLTSSVSSLPAVMPSPMPVVANAKASGVDETAALQASSIKKQQASSNMKTLVAASMQRVQSALEEAAASMRAGLADNPPKSTTGYPYLPSKPAAVLSPSVTSALASSPLTVHYLLPQQDREFVEQSQQQSQNGNDVSSGNATTPAVRHGGPSASSSSPHLSTSVAMGYQHLFSDRGADDGGGGDAALALARSTRREIRAASPLRPPAQMTAPSSSFLPSPNSRGSTATKTLLCTECERYPARRLCHQCGDGFCEGCWPVLHAKGGRKAHSWSDVQPGQAQPLPAFSDSSSVSSEPLRESKAESSASSGVDGALAAAAAAPSDVSEPLTQTEPLAAKQSSTGADDGVTPSSQRLTLRDLDPSAIQEPAKSAPTTRVAPVNSGAAAVVATQPPLLLVPSTVLKGSTPGPLPLAHLHSRLGIAQQ